MRTTSATLNSYCQYQFTINKWAQRYHCQRRKTNFPHKPKKKAHDGCKIELSSTSNTDGMSCIATMIDLSMLSHIAFKDVYKRPCHYLLSTSEHQTVHRDTALSPGISGSPIWQLQTDVIRASSLGSRKLMIAYHWWKITCSPLQDGVVAKQYLTDQKAFQKQAKHWTGALFTWLNFSRESWLTRWIFFQLCIFLNGFATIISPQQCISYISMLAWKSVKHCHVEVWSDICKLCWYLGVRSSSMLITSHLVRVWFRRAETHATEAQAAQEDPKVRRSRYADVTRQFFNLPIWAVLNLVKHT